MTIPPELLALLRCPETGQSLRPAPEPVLARVNQAIRDGTQRNRGGQPVARSCDAGLLREDGRYLYPVSDRISVLLVNEAIPVH